MLSTHSSIAIVYNAAMSTSLQVIKPQRPRLQTFPLAIYPQMDLLGYQ